MLLLLLAARPRVTWLKIGGKINSTLHKKVKCTPVLALRLCTGCMAHRGSRGIALLFHDHGTRRRWGVSVTNQPLNSPGERPGTRCWVSPRAGLDRCAKSRPSLGFDPRTTEHVASHYTERATQFHCMIRLKFNLVEVKYYYIYKILDYRML
jgi:hypothetical protein